MLVKAGIAKRCDLIHCLIIMDLVKAEDSRAMYSLLSIDSRKKITAGILYGDLISNGTRVMIEDRELYSKIYSFDRTRDCRFNDSFGAHIDEIDFSVMVEKDIWSYIYGEYFFNNRLASEIVGFGLIKL